MAATGGLFVNEYTAALQKMVRQVVNDPATYKGSKYLPSVALPMSKIYIDIVEASGGLTNEHVLDTDPKAVQGIGVSTEEVEGGAWRETLQMGEKDILRLRQLGSGDTSLRGARQYIDLNVDKLNRRLEARIEYLRWQSILTGAFTYQGRTISFGIPGGNQATPLNAVKWSTDGSTANASANPIQDLRYWCLGGLSTFRKYKISKMVMNPNTARFILDNANVHSLIQYRFAAENFPEFDLNRTLQFLVPGLPVAEIYDGWYQTETVTSGKVTVSDAVYFIPDGYIFFEVSNLPGGDMIGEFWQGLHLASGSIEAPGFGKFLLIEDNTAPGTKGGPQRPYIDLVAGVNGGPKIDRPFDVITAYVL